MSSAVGACAVRNFTTNPNVDDGASDKNPGAGKTKQLFFSSDRGQLRMSGNVLSVFTEKLEFQAETRMLLDIVAKSLYSEKEVSWTGDTRTDRNVSRF